MDSKTHLMVLSNPLMRKPQTPASPGRRRIIRKLHHQAITITTAGAPTQINGYHGLPWVAPYGAAVGTAAIPQDFDSQPATAQLLSQHELHAGTDASRILTGTLSAEAMQMSQPL